MRDVYGIDKCILQVLPFKRDRYIWWAFRRNIWAGAEKGRDAPPGAGKPPWRRCPLSQSRSPDSQTTQDSPTLHRPSGQLTCDKLPTEIPWLILKLHILKNTLRGYLGQNNTRLCLRTFFYYTPLHVPINRVSVGPEQYEALSHLRLLLLQKPSTRLQISK